MNEWLVDTNVIIDVIVADPQFGERSHDVLEELSRKGILIINPVVYAEIGAICDSIEELDSLLPETLFRREAMPWDASFLAGQAYMKYKKNKGKKSRILADFLIAAHATVNGYGLVTRDRGHKNYFHIDIIDPNASD